MMWHMIHEVQEESKKTTKGHRATGEGCIKWCKYSFTQSMPDRYSVHKECRVGFNKADWSFIEEDSQRNAQSKAAYIRERALATQPLSIATGPKVFANAVEAAAECIPGASRAQVEHAVSRVIVTIAAQQ